MPSIDLGLEYRGGVLVPSRLNQGQLALVGAPDQEGSVPFEYGRTAKPPAIGADATETDYLDLIPAIYRLETVDAVPQRVATIPLDANYDGLIRVASVATNGTIFRRQFVRWRGYRLGAGIVDLYTGDGLEDDEVAAGALAPAGLTRTLISSGVQIFVAGIAATTLQWTVRIQAERIRMRVP